MAARGPAVSMAARGREAADPEEGEAASAVAASAAVLKAEAAALAEAVPASEKNNTRKTKRELNRFPFGSLLEFGQAIPWKIM